MNTCARCETQFSEWSMYYAHHINAKCSKKIVPVRTTNLSKGEIVSKIESSVLKGVLVMGLVITLSGFASANCGNGPDGAGLGCSGQEGPQGDPGQPGINGVDGQNGTNGIDGVNGKDGKDGKSPSSRVESKLVLDTAVRLYDGKRVQLQAFNTFGMGRHNGQDLLDDGHNMMFGARIVFKLGSSYEERLLAKQAAQIEALQAALARVQ